MIRMVNVATLAISMMATMMIKSNAHNLSNSLRSMEATTADADDDDDHCIFM